MIYAKGLHTESLSTIC